MAELPNNSPEPHKLRYRSWRDDVGAEFRRFTSHLTRENVISNLKTLAWVVPLTLLIWIWAEREQVQPAPDVAVPFELTSIDPNRSISLKPPQDNNLVLELSGPMARLQELLNRLRGGTMPQGLKLEVPTTYAVNQDYTLVTMELINNQRIFRDYGVTVQRVQPAHLMVSINELVEREAKVILPPSAKNIIATFDPPTVKVRGPRNLLDRAAQNGPERGQLIVFAAADAMSRVPGHYDLPDIAVTAPEDLKDDRVKINDAHTKVRANVDDKYKLDVPRPAVQNVTIIGPPDIIDQMQKPDYEPQPKARLVITATDLAALDERRTKVVQYDLPKGVDVSPEDKKKTVEYRVLDRSAPPNP